MGREASSDPHLAGHHKISAWPVLGEAHTMKVNEPEEFECIDELDYSWEETMEFEKVPSNDELVEVEEFEEVEADCQEEEEEEVEDEEEEKPEEPPAIEFDPSDELDVRRFNRKAVRSVHYTVDLRRRNEHKDLSSLTYKQLYINVGERECIDCPETCFSMCARCGVLFSMQIRNDQ